MATPREIRTMAADMLAEGRRASLLSALGQACFESAADEGPLGVIALQQEVLVELGGEIGGDALGWADQRPVDEIIAALRGEDA